MKINEIFTGLFQEIPKNIIKTVQINDENYHKNGIISIIKYFESNYVLTDLHKKVISDLFYYFTGNKEKSTLNLNKGICICGGKGTGKTLLMKVFKEYTKGALKTNSFVWHDVKSIIENVNVIGYNYFSTINFISDKATTIYIDDIASGLENIKHFGTEINSIETLLTLRYDIFKRFGKLTHLSSNKYPIELEKIYDDRVTDRLKEMVNFVELDCESFRK